MIERTHVLIATIIRQTINKENNKEILTSSFIDGSIIPDHRMDFYFIKHTFDDCFGIIKKYIKESCVCTSINNKTNINLGIISHYISDIFCRFHNQNYWNLLQHSNYEQKLHYFLANEINLNYLVDKIDELIEDADLSNYEDIIHAIEYYRRKYLMNLEHSNQFTDCEYSLGIPLMVTRGILEMVKYNCISLENDLCYK